MVIFIADMDAREPIYMVKMYIYITFICENDYAV